jgi:hypothetical protein
VFANASPLSARVVPFIDDRGAEVVVVPAKATFRRRGADLALADEQAPVRLVDVPTDPRAEAEGVVPAFAIRAISAARRYWHIGRRRGQSPESRGWRWASRPASRVSCTRAVSVSG